MRISVTDVDSFRYYQRSEDMTLDDILRRLRHEEPATPAMEAGRAFHRFLETHDGGEVDHCEVDGFRFHFELDAEISLPPVREIKAEFPVVVDGVPVTLVGKVDAIHGKRVDDHKLTSRFDAERYADAFQWRAYLHIFGADAFRYNVFTGSETKHGWVIRAYDELPLYRYPGLERDVMRMLREFVDFAREHMPERKEAA